MSRKVTTISDRVAMERCLRNMVKDQLKRIKELKAENAQLHQHLKYNTKQVCEKIRKELSNVGKTYLEDKPYIEICIVQGILNQIENEKESN